MLIHVQVDSERLGAFTFNDLAAYMGIRPANEYNSSEDGDEESEEETEDAEA